MDTRTLGIGVGALLLVGLAYFTLAPSSGGGEAPGSHGEGSPDPPPAEAPSGNPDFRSPDIAQPLPKRSSGDLAQDRRREGIRPGGPPHDFAQEYPATPDAVEDGLVARSHRFLACADVHGAPIVRPRLGEDDDEGDPVLQVNAIVTGRGGAGQLALDVPGAPPQLMTCLKEAVMDMHVAHPGVEPVGAIVDIALDPE